MQDRPTAPSQQQPLPRCMRLRQVVAYTNISVATINRALQDGRLTRLKAGRTTLIETADVDRWIDSMRRAA
jgi:excisionase family DNA binding protein